MIFISSLVVAGSVVPVVKFGQNINSPIKISPLSYASMERRTTELKNNLFKFDLFKSLYK